MVKVGIVGGAGYTGGELIRYLSRHPGVRLEVVTSETLAGTPVASHYRNFRLDPGIIFSPYRVEELAGRCEFVFLAKPEPDSFTQVRELFGSARLIDLSANFRYREAADFERWYGVPHKAPEKLEHAVYGLSEIFPDQVRFASLVANPGCYPTAVLLALVPPLLAGLFEPEISISAISGFSGAGRTPSAGNMACSLVDNVRPYRVGVHPHAGELEEVVVRRLEAGAPDFTFVPQVAGFERGILSVIFTRLKSGFTEGDARDALLDFYREADFVRVLEAGAQPEIRNVVGTNHCEIGLAAAGTDRLVLTSAIDNLVKGASGQAIQNMNLMAGLPGCTALF